MWLLTLEMFKWHIDECDARFGLYYTHDSGDGPGLRYWKERFGLRATKATLGVRVTVHALAPPRSLAEVCDLNSGVSFPGAALEGCETALCLFSAAWWGRQDAYWVADAGLHGTCVDTDGQRLAEMAEHLSVAAGGSINRTRSTTASTSLGRQQWDVVTLDPFTSLVDRCAEDLGLWCAARPAGGGARHPHQHPDRRAGRVADHARCGNAPTITAASTGRCSSA